MIDQETSEVQNACLKPPRLSQRPLLALEQAAELSALFKIFANPNRLRRLPALIRAGEIRVGDLAAALDMKVQAVSNQLLRLADRGFIAAMREGQNIYYRVKNPCLPDILEYGLCLLEATTRKPK